MLCRLELQKAKRSHPWVIVRAAIAKIAVLAYLILRVWMFVSCIGFGSPGVSYIWSARLARCHRHRIVVNHLFQMQLSNGDPALHQVWTCVRDVWLVPPVIFLGLSGLCTLTKCIPCFLLEALLFLPATDVPIHVLMLLRPSRKKRRSDCRVPHDRSNPWHSFSCVLRATRLAFEHALFHSHMHTCTRIHAHAWVARFTNPYCLCVLECLCSSPSFLMFCLPLWGYSRIILEFLNKVPAVMFVGRALLRGEFCESGERNHVQCRVLVWGCCRASIAFFHGESPLLTVDWACEFTYSFFPFCLAVLCFFLSTSKTQKQIWGTRVMFTKTQPAV